MAILLLLPLASHLPKLPQQRYQSLAPPTSPALPLFDTSSMLPHQWRTLASSAYWSYSNIPNTPVFFLFLNRLLPILHESSLVSLDITSRHSLWSSRFHRVPHLRFTVSRSTRNGSSWSLLSSVCTFTRSGGCPTSSKLLGMRQDSTLRESHLLGFFADRVLGADECWFFSPASSESQYKYRIKKWKLKKSTSTSKKAAIYQVIQTRAQLGKSSAITRGGQEIDTKNLRRYLKTEKRKAIILQPGAGEAVTDANTFSGRITLSGNRM